jgi:hypothetical protein
MAFPHFPISSFPSLGSWRKLVWHTHTSGILGWAKSYATHERKTIKTLQNKKPDSKQQATPKHDTSETVK